jgi:uncharacterized SAM-dependent methyltransferase
MDVHSEIVINDKRLSFPRDSAGSIDAVGGRIEMHVASRKDQIANAAGNTFAFRKGELLHTENSHKFSVAMFTRLAAEAGWSANKIWISDAPRVALFRLELIPGENF